MSDLMTYILELRFYEFKILFIRIFHSDCRWICRLTTPLLISTISKYHLEIDNLNDPFLWRIKSNTCATGKNAYTIHSKITDIGEEVVSLQFPNSLHCCAVKGTQASFGFPKWKHSCQVSHGCHISVTVLSVDSMKWLNQRNRRVRGFFVFPNPPELNQNYPIRPEVSTTRELIESFGQIFI